MSGKSLKKKRSDKQRLAALREKRNSSHRLTSLQIPALASYKPSNHIVFTDDSEPEKMTLFSDGTGSDDEDCELGGGGLFEGAAGEKLLHLQRRIGVDQRFRLNKMFRDSEEAVDMDIENKDVDDERSRSLAVIDTMLGCGHTQIKRVDDVVIPPRYDPLCSSHTYLEQQEVTEQQEAMVETSSSDDEPGMPAPVCQEKYFTINTNLKDLFDSQGFSFLDEQSESSSEVVADESSEVGGSDVPLVMPVQPAVCTEDVTMNRTFFLHSCEPVSHSFHCDSPKAAREERWSDRRTALKQIFRKRSKEASRGKCLPKITHKLT